MNMVYGLSVLLLVATGMSKAYAMVDEAHYVELRATGAGTGANVVVVAVPRAVSRAP